MNSVRQPFFEPEDRFDIEVVGRFVEEQHVRVDGQDLGQGDAHFPAAAECFHRGLKIEGDDAETGEDGLGPRFEVVAATLLKDLDGLAVAFKQVGQLVIGHGLGHRLLHFPDPAGEGDEVAGGRHHLGLHRASGHFADILGKITDNGLLGTADLALIRLFFAGYESEDGGLASPVRADQAGAGGGEYLQAGVVEENLTAVLFADIGEMDHSFVMSLIPLKGVETSTPARGIIKKTVCRD